MSVVRVSIDIDHVAVRGFGTNTFHLQTPGPAEAALADLDAAMEALEEMYSGLTSICAGGVVFSFDGVYTTVDEDPTILSGDGEWTVTSGTAFPALPAATAMVLGWTTASATRSGKGRSFISPIAQNTSAGNGSPTTEAVTGARTQAQILLSHNASSPPATFVVWSPKNQVARLISGARVSNEYAVLRSRRD